MYNMKPLFFVIILLTSARQITIIKNIIPNILTDITIMLTVFNKKTRFTTTNFNTNKMAPVNKNIVFEIVDDFELDINTDDVFKNDLPVK